MSLSLRQDSKKFKQLAQQVLTEMGQKLSVKFLY